MTRHRLLAPISLALMASACSGALPGPSASQIAHEIEMNGARRTVSALDRNGQFDTVLDRIATGDTAWVKLAPRLAQGTDASDSGGVAVALATALPKNPTAVLRVLDDGPVLGTSVVCGAPFIEPEPHEMKSYLELAIPAVSAVPAGDHTVRRASCLKRLDEILRLLEAQP